MDDGPQIEDSADQSDDLHSFRYFPYPGPRMEAPHAHNDIELNLVVSGRVTYLFGPCYNSLAAGALCVFWAAIPHQIIQLADSTRYFAVHLPLAYFLQWRLPQQFTHRILQGETISSTSVADADFNVSLFERWHRHIHLNDAEYRHATLLEIEATLRCLALSAQAAPATQVHTISGTGVEEIEVMVEILTRRFQEPLTVGEVAAAVNLHPNYAMQLFRRYTGRTIVSYLNQYRIAHAQQLLLTTDRSVLDIAYDSGFNSLSRFYAVFRSTCNLSPGRYRQTLRQHG